MDFKPISLDRKEDYLEHLSRCPQTTSDYSFVNLWGWSDEHGILWSWDDGLVWIKQTHPEELYWAPVGDWREMDWEDRFNGFPDHEATFVRVPEELAMQWKSVLSERVTAEETRGHWDYLYSGTELVELSGNRFHSKKNLLNQFKKNYDFKYMPFGREMIDKALEMQSEWCTWRDCESSETLSAENRAIEKTLKAWKRLEDILAGGALLVGQDMVAYTIAEYLTREMLLIHYEKACPDFKGAYQAINQVFLENAPHRFERVNREQDLGDEGLRKAKLSYNPIGFLKKYRVRLR